MSSYVVDQLKNVIDQQEEQLVLLKKTVERLSNPKHASSLPSMPESDPIAINIIANSPGFIYWKNKKGQYMGCNNDLARISGLNDRSEIVGKTDDDFEWGKGQAEKFRAADLEVMRDKCVKVYEDRMPIKRPDGHYYYIRTEKRPLYENGKIIGVVANAFDITDQKILEEKLNEQKELSEQANLAKTEFIRNIEHDTRTPFNGIWATNHFLWEQETDPMKKELLGDVTQCAKEFLDYLNEIVDFSKISSGSFPVMEKKFDLHKLLDSVLKIEIPAAKKEKLLLISQFSKDLPKIVMGDHYRLFRLLINLVGNAIKFTKEGQVSIHVKLLKKIDDAYLIRFTIKDTGEGIPLEQQNYIFEKFSRLSPSNKGLYKGSGLGLRIVKQFIEEMKGEIDLKSKLGEGTEFICTIPFKIPLTNDFA